WEIDPDERAGWRTPLNYYFQSPDHAPPHYGYSERRRFSDRVFRYAGHYSTQIRIARKHDGICARFPGRCRRGAVRDGYLRKVGRRRSDQAPREIESEDIVAHQ